MIDGLARASLAVRNRDKGVTGDCRRASRLLR
jgi:hypothetical protein